MDKHQRRSTLVRMMLLGTPFIFGSAVYAAKPVDLGHQPVKTLQEFISTPGMEQQTASGVEEISRSSDFNKTLHIRIQQTYAGYPVWGADAVVHIPNGSQANAKSIADVISAGKDSFMNGKLYADLQQDLAGAPKEIFTKEQADKALRRAEQLYSQTVTGESNYQDQSSDMIVYIDKANVAHYAYKVSFFAPAAKSDSLPAKPIYIIDAKTLDVLSQWDNLQTSHNKSTLCKSGELCPSFGGGYGGNPKAGKLIYDGWDINGHLKKLWISRDDAAKNCFLQNEEMSVVNLSDSKVVSYSCARTDKNHNDIYWNEELGSVNDGYSSSNDGMYGAQITRDLFRHWYGKPVLIDVATGDPMHIKVVVHLKVANAYWNGKYLSLGDGSSSYYPLTELDIVAHELGHGYTEQHAGLFYQGESGGMNESFSDMVGQAALFFVNHMNDWKIGASVYKNQDRSIRYMDHPSKDCGDKKPGDWCSIDTADQYYDGLDVHFSSGLFNRAFYLMSTSEKWNAKKAFDLFLHANTNYWTQNSSFVEGACGVVQSAKDYNFDVSTVTAAFTAVGIDTGKC